MSESIQRSHFWVFDAEQLEAAIAEYWPSQPQPDEFEHGPDLVRGFLNAATCRRRGMRRGGED